MCRPRDEHPIKKSAACLVIENEKTVKLADRAGTLLL